MKPTYYFLILLLSSLNLNAQIGINTTTPDSSSILDISASDKGILIPRVSLLSLTDKITIVDPVNSLLVFNKIALNNVQVGYYYWSTPYDRWIKMLDELDKPGVILATFDNSKTDIKTTAFIGDKSFNFKNIDFNSVIGTSFVGNNLILPPGSYMIESSVNINRDSFFYTLRINTINNGVVGTMATVKTQAEIVARGQQAVFTITAPSSIDFYPLSNAGGASIPVDPKLSYLKIVKF